MWIAVLYNLVTSKERGFDAEIVAENEILATARAVVRALAAEHRVVALKVSAELLAGVVAGGSRFDLVFNLAEGIGDRGGSEHLVAALLESGGLAYTGSDAASLALTRDKARTKRLLAAAGLVTPAWQLFQRPEEELEPGLEPPLIVKPSLEDASIGITAASVARDEQALRRQLRFVLEHYRQPALVERYIEGREIACALLGNGAAVEALPLSEIVFRGGGPHIVTFESKWVAGSEADRSQPPVCPADLDPGLAREIARAARAAFSITGCRDYARIDFRLAEDARGRITPAIIDVNANPAIDEGAGFARSARAAGLDYPALIGRIAAMAAARGPRQPAREPVVPVEGARLRLEPPEPGHLGALARWFSDPQTGLYMDEPGRSYGEEELAEAFFVARAGFDFVACERSSGRPVGYCGLYDLDRSNGRARITFLVGEPSERNRGLGREIGELLLREAFERLGLHALEAAVVVENRASLRLCRALGFREIGRTRGSHRLGDRRLDEILLEMTRDEYPASSA